MTQFVYTVSDPQTGMKTSGLLVARDRDVAARMLTEKNLVVTRLAPVVRMHQRFLESLGLGGHRLKGEQVLALTEQLGAMLGAGMTLKSAVDVILGDTRDSRVRTLLLEMSTSLGAGNSLTEVLARYPAIFDQQYLALVATGESGGKLADVMGRLAAMIENSLQLKKKVQSAFYYPAFVIFFAMSMVFALFTFGIPKFEEIYRGMGTQLPPMTLAVIGIGRFFSTYWAAMLIAGLLLVIACMRLSKTERGRRVFDLLKLRLPIMGPLMQKLAIARFARTLSTLHSSGVSFLHSLDLVASSMGNAVLEDVVRSALREVAEGESITDPLRRSGWFTEMSVSMIAAGERSGTLDVMLDRIAEYYERQVDTALKGLASLLEPVIMVGVGGIVGTVIIAMILPIFRLATLFMR